MWHAGSARAGRAPGRASPVRAGAWAAGRPCARARPASVPLLRRAECVRRCAVPATLDHERLIWRFCACSFGGLGALLCTSSSPARPRANRPGADSGGERRKAPACDTRRIQLPDPTAPGLGEATAIAIEPVVFWKSRLARTAAPARDTGRCTARDRLRGWPRHLLADTLGCIFWRLRSSWLVGRRMTAGDLLRCGEKSFREDALSADTFWRCCGRVRERTSVRAGRQGRVKGEESFFEMSRKGGHSRRMGKLAGQEEKKANRRWRSVHSVFDASTSAWPPCLSGDILCWDLPTGRLSVNLGDFLHLVFRPDRAILDARVR